MDIQLLKQACQSPVEGIRIRAIVALGVLVSETLSALPNLVALAADRSAGVSYAVMETFGLIVPVAVSALPLLCRALTDEDVTVLRRAAQSLGGWRISAIPALPDLVQVARWEVTGALCRAQPYALQEWDFFGDPYHVGWNPMLASGDVNAAVARIRAWLACYYLPLGWFDRTATTALRKLTRRRGQ